MKYFIYDDFGEIEPTLYSTDDILDFYWPDKAKLLEKVGYSFDCYSTDSIISMWKLDHNGREIEYSGVGPIAPRWVKGAKTCLHTDCAHLHDCVSFGHMEWEYFAYRPDCHSKIAAAEIDEGHLVLNVQKL